VNTDQALEKLIQSTAEAVVGVLETFCPGQVELGGMSAVSVESDPLGGLPGPIVGANVSYVNGVTGGNVFAMPLEGARALAAAMMGRPTPDDVATELSELELSAVAEAMNQMMAAGAAATGAVLGQEVEISPPEVAVYPSSEAVMAEQTEAAHCARAGLTVAGAPARLLQLVPKAFIVRMTRALDERGSEYSEPVDGATGAPAGGEANAVAENLRNVPVKLWAELGRAEMQTGRLVGLSSGAVVELDRRADDPVDIYVNGLRFASGRLIVVDGTEWAVRIESVAGVAAGQNANLEGVMG
jgi:flagellar motor switch protein FliN/FliY